MSRKTAQMSLGLAPLSPSSMLYVLYVLYGRQSPGSLLYVRYRVLTRQAAEPPLSPSSILYVLYVLYYSVRALKCTICAIQCIFGTCWRCYVYSTQASIPYSTYSTYSMELGESAGWVSYCSASPNCASLGKAASRECPARVQCARAGGLQRSVRVPSGFCLVCALKRQAPVSRITGRCTRPSNSPPWRSPCRTRTFASRAQSP